MKKAALFFGFIPLLMGCGDNDQIAYDACEAECRRQASTQYVYEYCENACAEEFLGRQSNESSNNSGNDGNSSSSDKKCASVCLDYSHEATCPEGYYENSSEAPSFSKTCAHWRSTLFINCSKHPENYNIQCVK